MNAKTLLAVVLSLSAVDNATSAEAKRPNVLWLTCEDISPHLGCYGDKDAKTPNLDAFAKQAVRYDNAFAAAGVCAPSRSTLILGAYATTFGSHYMRCQAELPEGVRCFPEYLRKAGYYCTNNVKEDYNFKKPPGTWDESSNKAHYRNRKESQPFFAVFNNVQTHEGQIRMEAGYKKHVARLKADEFHDPKKITIPPFHPDVPEVRRDWARYRDLITVMDKWFGDHLAALEKAGLADDTIVFFFSDHGAGLPRGKRWLYDTGWRVPLLVRFGKNVAHLAPGKPGTATDRLVSFVDFGPTVLSLCGVKIPEHAQGVPFLGEKAAKPREAVFGIRDRMDERNDCTRAVRDKRYKLIRNYHAYKPWAQKLEYAELMPTMQVWRKLAAPGKLTGSAALWMRPTKPFEELYDLQNDPHELKNLAGDNDHEKTLHRLRKLHADWHRQTRDLGLMPEAEVYARSKGRTPYALGKDEKAFPRDKLLAAAETLHEKEPLEKLLKLLADDDAAVRWWAATGLGLQGGKKAEEALAKSLKDRAGVVRVAAADGLRRLGKTDAALPVLSAALTDDNPWVRHEAALAIDEMGAKAAPAKEALVKALDDKNDYVVRVVRHTLKGLGERS
jgi:N-sulfoglucosamine sulfohydrolase